MRRRSVIGAAGQNSVRQFPLTLGQGQDFLPHHIDPPLLLGDDIGQFVNLTFLMRRLFLKRCDVRFGSTRHP